MKCKVCERENPEGALFCGNCGSPFEKENSQQTSEVVHTEQPYANEPEYVTDNKSTLTSRMIRASMFDIHAYEEVEADKSATKQALTVVLIVALIGSLPVLVSGDLRYLLFTFIASVCYWAVWAFITYFIGTKILPEQTTDADWGQLLRTTGFAQSPGVLTILGIIPGVGSFIALPIMMWQIGTMVMAVRQALDYKSTLRAVGVVLIGIIPALISLFFIAVILIGLLGLDAATVSNQ